MISVSRTHEWLEADGLGGYASGTTSGVNTRRYHALLLVAERPPADRRVLVNDAAVWLEGPGEPRYLSQHRYAPDVVSRLDAKLVSFDAEPWPRFSYQGDDFAFEREVIALHGLPVVLSTYRFSRLPAGARLCLRPLLSGRDFHALHHENAAFSFEAVTPGRYVRFQPYPSVTGIVSVTDGAYRHVPEWYRNFLYERERDRGLDFLEDLGSPGVHEFTLADPEVHWVVAADTPEVRAFLGDRTAKELAVEIVRTESARRRRFATRVERAVDAYVVKRGEGRTVIAGYPWFGDWGRDTFISLRGLCLATGRFTDARGILGAWASVVSDGMLPNRFADRDGERPEYNSVDAALWYVVCVGELLARAGDDVPARERDALVGAVHEIVVGHLSGTRHGIRVDGDGLLAAGEHGVQLTWMDAKVGDWVVTPRIGKPVEIQALWLHALSFAARLLGGHDDVLARGLASFESRFWNERAGCLFDVVDVDHEPGRTDDSIRPNQVFAAGGLPVRLLSGARARAVVDTVERELWTPLGLRSLSRSHPDYRGTYRGGVFDRDSAYHQGTVWPWLAGPFIEAWVVSRGGTPDAKTEARRRFFEPLASSLTSAGIGHLPEIADGDAPHAPGGCLFQAWSLSEMIRIAHSVLTDEPASRDHAG
ncbi:MAG TPA: amylo-alpha-1,6-glucosidase [Polyangiaceae bacterium]|nr:amylo-alpha-1,6-glucosidase [Polyangiaceae bacterium]